jgi:AcrR family transcriptional regulator
MESTAAPPEPPPSESLLLRVPQQDRSRRTLDGFIDAARQLLEEGGEDAVTVSDVVRHAGVSVGAFYARFDGRDELVRYLGERSLEHALEGWTEPEADLAHALERLAREFASGPARTLALLDGRLDPEPTRLARFEAAVAERLAVLDGFPRVDAETDALRARFIVAGIRELADHTDPERLAGVGRACLGTELAEDGDEDGMSSPTTTAKESGDVDLFDVWG